MRVVLDCAVVRVRFQPGFSPVSARFQPGRPVEIDGRSVVWRFPLADWKPTERPGSTIAQLSGVNLFQRLFLINFHPIPINLGGGEGGRRRAGEQLPLITNGRWRPFCTFKFPRLYISFNGGRRTTDRSALAAKQSTATPSRTRNQSDDGEGAERPLPGGPRQRHLATAFPTHRGIHYFGFNFDSGALLAGKLATALISFIRV